MYVMDENLNICPMGVKGEICIGGVGLAKGYLDVYKRQGPAYVLFEKVALASARAGAVYVDVTDALMFNDEVMSRVDGKGKFYIAAGYYPGITGVMLKKVIEMCIRDSE